jgi:predicted transcriptional regulator
VLQEKLYYLKQIEDGCTNHRTIMKKMVRKFETSATVVRDALIAEGLIEFVRKELLSNGRFAYFYRLTGKELVVPKQQDCGTTWADGTAKSTGNAFDWRNKEQGIFTKAQIAQMQQKQVSNSFPITTYSRA